MEEEEGTRQIFEISNWSPCQSWLPATGGGGGGHKSINGVHTYLVMHSRTQQGRHKKEETSAQMGAVALDGHHARRVLQNASFFVQGKKILSRNLLRFFAPREGVFQRLWLKRQIWAGITGRGEKLDSRHMSSKSNVL